MFAVAAILGLVDIFSGMKGVIMDTLVSLGLPLLVITAIAVIIAFYCGICFGEKRSQREQDVHVRRLSEELEQLQSRFHESISQLNRTTNTILASIVRSGSNDSPIDSQAVYQLVRRINNNEMPPLDWDTLSDRNPRNWGHYVSHPDEHGYVTPFGLTMNEQEAQQWRRVGQLILGIEITDENGNKTPLEKHCTMRHEVGGKLMPKPEEFDI